MLVAQKPRAARRNRWRRMIYLFWTSPFLLVVLLLATGRASSAVAGLCAALGAAAVALLAAPHPMAPTAVLLAAAKGLWLAALVGAVILGGLFFRRAAAPAAAGGAPAAGNDASSGYSRRARAFAACFLLGPFAEAATGFGVGQVAAVASLSALGLAPLHVALLALLSQTLVPWGAMANGTVVGAEFARMHVADLGFRSALLTAPLLFAWLLLLWRMAAGAGLPAARSERFREGGWLLAVALLLPLVNRAIGAEVAALAILGPLIALRFWLEERPNRARFRTATRLGLPYGVLITAIAASRGIPDFGNLLTRVGGVVRPFADGPAWAPLMHPSTWLLLVGLGAALLDGGRDGPRAAAAALQQAWRQGRRAVLTIAAFLIAARIIADAEIAGALADGLHAKLGRWTVIATPTLAGAFGLLTGSSNASNGLLMASQVGLADDGSVPAPWIAALQNTAAAALTMLSPARVAMGCALAGQREMEREVYRRGWLLGAAALLVLTAAAVGLILVA